MAGVVLPKNAKGDRSSTAFNKAVYSAMAKAIGDDALASSIESEKDWRHQYIRHVDKLTKALVDAGDRGGDDGAKALQALRAGLQQVRAMEFEAADGTCQPLESALASGGADGFDIAREPKTSAKNDVGFDVAVEYGGASLSVDQIEEQSKRWAGYGSMEPDCAEAIAAGARQMAGDGKTLQGRTFVVLGASSELCPTKQLLQAGATVVAVARRKPDRWKKLIDFARGTSGTLLFPVPKGKAEDASHADAGADLIADAPAVVDWVRRCIAQATGPVTVGTYLYLDGEANLRVTAVADYIVEQASGPWLASKDKLSFAWLASCSTTLVIPPAAEAAQAENFGGSTWFQKATGTRQACASVRDGSLYNGLEVMQGPNYALAQTMRQWRAMLLHADGFVVSTPVTPMCRTESVTSNKTMAVVLQGVAHLRPLEAFDPQTCRNLMFYILVSDLAGPVPTLSSPFHLFKRKAFHSGLWRCGFVMNSLAYQIAAWGKLAPKTIPDGVRTE